jgi:glycerophosphoryl diester phosphodiesterase
MRLNAFFLLLAAIFGLGLMPGCVPQQNILSDNPFRIPPGSRPWVIAHGGGKDLFPENTLAAFRGADSIGVDMLEMDVNLTKDSVLVCLHDLTIDATSEGSGAALDYSFAELQQFNFGHDFRDLAGNYPYRAKPVRIPGLEEVMAAFPDAYLNIEIKNSGEDGKRAARQLKKLIEQQGAEGRVLAASFHDEVMRYFLEIAETSWAVSTSEEETKDFVFSGLSGMEFLYSPRGLAVQIPVESSGINLSAERLIRSAQRRNMAVHYWTINDKAEMRRLIEAGADGLITDRPDLMRELLAEMGF